MSFLPGLGALILIVLDIWAIISILGSPQTMLAKLIWILVVLFLPLIGPILWLIIGARA